MSQGDSPLYVFDLVQRIFSLLDSKSLAQCAQVCGGERERE